MVNEDKRGSGECAACMGTGAAHVVSYGLSGCPMLDVGPGDCDDCDGRGYLAVCETCDEVDYDGRPSAWDGAIWLCQDCYCDDLRAGDTSSRTLPEIPAIGLDTAPLDLCHPTHDGPVPSETSECVTLVDLPVIGGDR